MHEPHYEAAWAAMLTQNSSHTITTSSWRSLGLTQLGLILDLPIGDPRVDVVQAERDVLWNGHPHFEDLRHPVCHNVQELRWQNTLREFALSMPRGVCSGAGTPMLRVSGQCSGPALQYVTCVIAPSSARHLPVSPMQLPCLQRAFCLCLVRLITALVSHADMRAVQKMSALMAYAREQRQSTKIVSLDRRGGQHAQRVMNPVHAARQRAHPFHNAGEIHKLRCLARLQTYERHEGLVVQPPPLLVLGPPLCTFPAGVRDEVLPHCMTSPEEFPVSDCRQPVLVGAHLFHAGQVERPWPCTASCYALGLFLEVWRLKCWPMPAAAAAAQLQAASSPCCF